MMAPYRQGYSIEEQHLASPSFTATHGPARERLVRALVERRLARGITGGIGIAGAILVAALLVARGGALLDVSDANRGQTALAFAVVVAVTLASYPVGRLVLRAARAFGGPLAHAEQQLARRATWSLALPLVAFALLAPLTIHGLVYAAVEPWQDPPTPALRGFGDWMMISGVIVGHVHLVAAALVGRFARRLERASHDELTAMKPARRGAIDVLVLGGVACVPGVVLLALPPALTLVTGIVSLPFAYAWARRVALVEREAAAPLEEARPDLDALEAARAARLAGA